MRAIDINSDLGESFGNWTLGSDDVLIPIITAANVACGFHASDPITLIKDGRIHYRNIPQQQSLEDWNEFWQEYKNAS